MASIQHVSIFYFQRLEPISKDLKLEQQRVPKFQQKVEETQVCSVLATVDYAQQLPLTSLSVCVRVCGHSVCLSVCACEYLLFQQVILCSVIQSYYILQFIEMLFGCHI